MKGNYWLYNFYRYDLRGNRISRYQEIDDYTDINYTYTYDMSDRMLSETINYKDNETEKTTEINYTYDERGNLTNSTSTDGTVKDYVYDRFYRLVKYKEGDNLTVYEYTADNLRAAKIVNGERTEYVWDGMNMAYEHGSETDNTYAYDMTGVHMSGGDVYIKDGHGNVIGSYGTATGSADVYYDAFGNVIYGSKQPTPFGYCGEYRDEESGLIYLRNRYYDSNTGRFITEDPIQDGLNWYSYCDGNPVMFVDPSGLVITVDEEDCLIVQQWINRIGDIDTEYGDVGYEINQIYQTDKKYSQQLIKKLIEADKIVHVNVGKAIPYETYGIENLTNMIVPADESLSGNIEIYIDPFNEISGIGANSWVKYEGDSYYVLYKEEITPFLQLAHEFVHAEHMIDGTYVKPSNNTSHYKVEPYTGNYIHIEEYNTIGFDNSKDDVTENKIRQEHSYNERISYYTR